MKNLFNAIVSGFLGLILMTCSFSSGPESGTTHGSNFLRGVVVGASGETLSNSQVTVRQIKLTESGQHTVEQRSFNSMEDGSFYFENLNNGRHVLTVQNSNFSAITSRVFLNDNVVNIPDIKVNKSFNISGRVLTDNLEPKQGVSVSIAGTDISSQTDNDGVYVLESAKSGEFELIFFNDEIINIVSVSCQSSSTDEFIYVRDVVLKSDVESQKIYEQTNIASFINTPVVYEDEPDWYYFKNFDYVKYQIFNQEDGIFQTVDEHGDVLMLVENFEDISSSFFNGKFKPTTHWFVYDDRANNANSAILPDGVYNDITKGVSYEDAFLNRSFNVEFQLDSNPGEYGLVYAAAGFRFRNEYRDLSNFNYISFFAKGEGLIRVEFVSEFILELQESWAHLGYELELNETWQKIVIHKDEIVPQEGTLPEFEGVVWDDINSNILAVDFRTQMPAGSIIKLQLDEVYISGF